MKRTALFIKRTVFVLVIILVSIGLISCLPAHRTLPPDDKDATSSSAPLKTAASTESVLPAATEDPAEVDSTDAADATESVLPTQTFTATPAGTHTEIAESFFNGTWKSTSGMLYIFDGKIGTITLKDVSTGEVLLEGSYRSSTEDFNEYRLSMTFHGETDSFIAWKYEDTGSVRLIIEATGVMYDLLHRVGG